MSQRFVHGCLARIYLGTSGRSTKLIHGGIRYLESAFKDLDKEMWDLVQEALSEARVCSVAAAITAPNDLWCMQRSHLMNAAPFMAHPLPIIIPIHTWWEIPYMYIGAKASHCIRWMCEVAMFFIFCQVYDFLAGSRRMVPKSYFISRVSWHAIASVSVVG